MGDDDQLDALLNNLTQQMGNVKNAGARERGKCFSCGKPITGELVEASGKTYHPDHFVCQQCRRPLHGQDYFEPDGKPHCESCYHKQFLGGTPVCAHCNEKIVSGKAIKAMELSWHPHHFVCNKCGENLEGKEFYEQSNKPYCAKDYKILFTNVCGLCQNPIQGKQVEAQKGFYHPDCFVCANEGCRISLAGTEYYAHNGKFYCESHYHNVASSFCACGKPIQGQYVNALGKKLHPGCFVCSYCKKSLAGGSYSEIDGQAYCAECDEKLF